MANPRLTTIFATTAAAGFGVGAALLGYHLIRADITKAVYRQRLEDVAAQYESLRDRYNQAVRRTAVTELLVEDGRLSVRIRNAAGVIKVIPTDFDPTAEIYVDYAVVDGRLWIRRIFDALTPPTRGLVIDPRLADIDWDDELATFGKAVYRSLDDGRWVITASGDGSLALQRASEEPTNLAAPLRLGSFEELETELQEEIARIGPADIWRQLWGH
ncbi:MAG: hypothetical protein D6695_02295 [Planctomycetota bacterium]|nr:MAG: hypothetical protein D6695_02295 [Planctomycetota bacterium]